MQCGVLIVDLTCLFTSVLEVIFLNAFYNKYFFK